VNLTAQQALKFQFFDNLYPTRDVPGTDPNRQPNYHLVGLMIILAFDDEVREATYPENGSPDPTLLRQHYGDVLNAGVATDEHIGVLGEFRHTFEIMRIAWKAMVVYNPEPCPARAAIRQLVIATQNLPGSGAPNPAPPPE
jgi:hypothetical protein